MKKAILSEEDNAEAEEAEVDEAETEEVDVADEEAEAVDYVINDVVDDTLPVVNTTKVIIKPYVSPDVKVINSYVYLDYQGYILEVSSKEKKVPLIEGFSRLQLIG